MADPPVTSGPARIPEVGTPRNNAALRRTRGATSWGLPQTRDGPFRLDFCQASDAQSEPVNASPCVCCAARRRGVGALGVAHTPGHAPKRYAVNALIGLTLLMYFGATAGLGLFWVARQELPIFEPHYVFGYLTIVLVLMHVGVNARQLLKYARQSSPRAFLRPATGEWRAPIRLLGIVASLVVFGGICFGLGLRRSAMTIVTSERPSARVPPTSSLPPPTLLLPLPTPAAEQLVTSDKTEVSVAMFYHSSPSHPGRSPSTSLGDRSCSSRTLARE